MPKTTKPTGGGKRHPLNMRTTRETRERLEAAASANGRSLAQEVEARLEQSFNSAESYLTELLGSRERLLMALTIADLIDDTEKETGNDWLADDVTFGRAAQKIVDWLYPPDKAAATLREIREITNQRLRRLG